MNKYFKSLGIVWWSMVALDFCSGSLIRGMERSNKSEKFIFQKKEEEKINQPQEYILLEKEDEEEREHQIQDYTSQQGEQFWKIQCEKDFKIKYEDLKIIKQLNLWFESAREDITRKKFQYGEQTLIDLHKNINIIKKKSGLFLKDSVLCNKKEKSINFWISNVTNGEKMLSFFSYEKLTFCNNSNLRCLNYYQINLEILKKMIVQKPNLLLSIHGKELNDTLKAAETTLEKLMTEKTNSFLFLLEKNGINLLVNIDKGQYKPIMKLKNKK